MTDMIEKIIGKYVLYENNDEGVTWAKIIGWYVMADGKVWLKTEDMTILHQGQKYNYASGRALLYSALFQNRCKIFDIEEDKEELREKVMLDFLEKKDDNSGILIAKNTLKRHNII